MKRAANRRPRDSAVGIVVLATLTLASITASCANRVAPHQRRVPPRPAPRTADGHPDLSGVWWAGNDVPLRPLADAARPAAPRSSGGGRASRAATAAAAILSSTCTSRGPRRKPRRSATRTTRRCAA